MFLKVFKRTFWIFYDNLLKGILFNFFIFILVLIPALFTFKMKKYELIFFIVTFWYVFIPAVMAYFIKVIKVEETKSFFSELLNGLRLFTLKSILILLINILFVIIALISINFYKNMTQLRQISIILGGLGIWIFLIFILMQIYILPIFVLDEKRRIFTSFKKALIMVMSAPFSSFFIFLTIAYLMILFYPLFLIIFGNKISFFLAFLSLFPIFLLPFISFTFIILLQLNATFLIYEKHKIFPDLTEIWEEKSLSNIFKPWETK